MKLENFTNTCIYKMALISSSMIFEVKICDIWVPRFAFLCFNCRCQRACESVHETSKEHLRQQLMTEFNTEKSDLIKKYEADCSKLQWVDMC